MQQMSNGVHYLKKIQIESGLYAFLTESSLKVVKS